MRSINFRLLQTSSAFWFFILFSCLVSFAFNGTKLFADENDTDHQKPLFMNGKNPTLEDLQVGKVWECGEYDVSNTEFLEELSIQFTKDSFDPESRIFINRDMRSDFNDKSRDPFKKQIAFTRDQNGLWQRSSRVSMGLVNQQQRFGVIKQWLVINENGILYINQDGGKEFGSYMIACKAPLEAKEFIAKITKKIMSTTQYLGACLFYYKDFLETAKRLSLRACNYDLNKFEIEKSSIKMPGKGEGEKLENILLQCAIKECNESDGHTSASTT